LQKIQSDATTTPSSTPEADAKANMQAGQSSGGIAGDYVNEHAARVSAEAGLFIRDRVLSIVSHDLRGPLNAIHSWAHVLERKLASEDPGIVRAIAGIRTGVEQQVKLIEDVIDKTRSATRNLALTLAPVALGPLVQAELDNVRATVARNVGAIIVNHATFGAEQVDIDGERFGQAVWSMLAYAVETAKPGSTINFDGHADGGEVEVSVSFEPAPPAAPNAAYIKAAGIFADSPAHLDNGALPLALPTRVAAAHDGELSNKLGEDGVRRIVLRHPARRVG
jgi:K+-sensing histidine kinase KdpD